MKRLKSPIFGLNHLFFRILLYFLSLLLPVIIISVAFYINVNSRIKTENIEKIHMNLQSSANTMDIYMRTVQETSMNIFYEQNLHLLPYGEYGQLDRVYMSEIPQRLLRIRNNLSAIIDNLFLIADGVKVYTGSGLDDFRDYFDRLYNFREYDYEYWQDKLQTEKSIEFLERSEVKTNNGSRKNVIPLVLMEIVNGNKVILVTTISVGMIHEMLQNNAVTGSSSFLVTDHLNNVVLSKHNRELSTDAMQSITDYFALGSSEYGEMDIDGIRSTVISVKSESYGWNYYAIVSEAELRKQTDYIFTWILIVCFVLFIAGIIFSFIFTFNLYNPIKRIRDILLSKNEESILADRYLTKYNEFEVIGKGIHQLLEFNHKFRSELETVSIHYKDQILLKFLHGNASLKDRNELHRILHEKLLFSHANYLCCNIKFGFKPAFYSEIQDTDRLVILEKIKNIIWATLQPRVDAYVLEEEQQFYICIFNVKSEDCSSQVTAALERLLDTFSYDSKYCFIHIGKGRTYSDIPGIKSSYADAMYALEAADQNNDFQLIDAGELPTVSMNYSYSFMDENIIINCLKSRNFESLKNKVDEILDKNGAAVTHLGISSLVSEMYNTGCRFLAEIGIDVQNVIKEEEHIILSTKSESLPNVNEKKRLLNQFFYQIIEQMPNKPADKSNTLISMIIKYIEENYHQDLYLEKIAEEMGVSAKYISRVFHEKTEINLTNYISRHRIYKAKELLIETDLTINTISQQVGIYSRTTFIRLFKKYEGITPLDYRKLKR